MEPERVDLGPLDPERDQLAYERFVRRVLAAAAPELERRATAAGPLALLAGWARPTVAAAAAIAVVALAALLATDRPDAAPDRLGAGGPPGLPAPVTEWLEAGRAPTATDVVLALEEGDL